MALRRCVTVPPAGDGHRPTNAYRYDQCNMETERHNGLMYARLRNIHSFPYLCLHGVLLLPYLELPPVNAILQHVRHEGRRVAGQGSVAIFIGSQTVIASSSALANQGRVATIIWLAPASD
jgi:hypothetical protein